MLWVNVLIMEYTDISWQEFRTASNIKKKKEKKIYIIYKYFDFWHV
jgi:hypothetical protein